MAHRGARGGAVKAAWSGAMGAGRSRGELASGALTAPSTPAESVLGACVWSPRGQSLYGDERRRRAKPYRWFVLPCASAAAGRRDPRGDRGRGLRFRRRLRLSAHHSDIGTRGVSAPRGRGLAGSSGPNRGSLTPRLLRVTASERRQRTPPRRAVASLANSVAPVT